MEIGGQIRVVERSKQQIKDREIEIRPSAQHKRERTLRNKCILFKPLCQGRQELLDNYNKKIRTVTTTIQSVEKRNRTQEEAKMLQENCALLPAIKKDVRRELGDLNMAIRNFRYLHRET